MTSPSRSQVPQPSIDIKGERAAAVVRELNEEGIRRLTGWRGGRRNPLILFLWYTACRECRERLPVVTRVGAELRARGLDVALVSVAPMDIKKGLSRFLDENRIAAYLLDEVSDGLAEELALHKYSEIAA